MRCKRYELVRCLSGCDRLEAVIEYLSEGDVTLAVVLSSTKVSEVPGITLASVRGDVTIRGVRLSPMDLPAIEGEVAATGQSPSVGIPPISPEGVPSPAIIVGGLCRVCNVKMNLYVSGLEKKPKADYVELADLPGGDIRECVGAPQAVEIYERAYRAGKELSTYDCVIIGESIPGGTTTAAAFLEALGYDALSKVSSTLPSRSDVKKLVVKEALKCLEGASAESPFDILKLVGDPMIPTAAGLAAALIDSGVEVVLGGGTQMAAVAALLKEVGVDLSNLAVATTKWVAEDSLSDFSDLLRQVSKEVTATYLSVDLSRSRFKGLRMYEQGYVKEGFALGAMLLLTYLRSAHSEEALINLVDSIYQEFLTRTEGIR